MVFASFCGMIAQWRIFEKIDEIMWRLANSKTIQFRFNLYSFLLFLLQKVGSSRWSYHSSLIFGKKSMLLGNFTVDFCFLCARALHSNACMSFGLRGSAKCLGSPILRGGRKLSSWAKP